MGIPGSREQDVRLGMRHRDIGDADIRPLVEYVLPMLTGVGRFVDTALVARPVRMAKDADIHRVGVVRINQDAADLLRVLESNVFPSRSAVIAAIHAIARCKIRADVGFSCADIDHVRIGICDRDRANGGDRRMIEDRVPYCARIGGFPYAAIDAAKEKFSMASGNSADSNNATRAKRTDESPLQSAVKRRRQRLRGERRAGSESEQQCSTSDKRCGQEARDRTRDVHHSSDCDGQRAARSSQERKKYSQNLSG